MTTFDRRQFASGLLASSLTAPSTVVQYDALGNVYRVVRATDDQAVVMGTFASLRDADAKLAALCLTTWAAVFFLIRDQTNTHETIIPTLMVLPRKTTR